MWLVQARTGDGRSSYSGVLVLPSDGNKSLYLIFMEVIFSQYFGLFLEQLVQYLGLLLEQLGQQHLGYFVRTTGQQHLDCF
jgi:hypothetical protein